MVWNAQAKTYFRSKGQPSFLYQGTIQKHIIGGPYGASLPFPQVLVKGYGRSIVPSRNKSVLFRDNLRLEIIHRQPYYGFHKFSTWTPEQAELTYLSTISRADAVKQPFLENVIEQMNSTYNHTWVSLHCWSEPIPIESHVRTWDLSLCISLKYYEAIGQRLWEK